MAIWCINSLLSIFLVSLLMGCSSSPSTQAVNDLFGLESLETSIVLEDTSQGLSSTALTIVGLGKITSSFTDINASSGANKFYVNIELADEVTVNAPNHPACSFEITDLEVLATVSDAQASITLPPLNIDKRLRLEPLSNSDTEYRITTQDAMIGGVIDGSDLSSLINIISNNGTNTAEITIQAEVFSVPALPKGAIITFTYRLARGVVDLN